MNESSNPRDQLFRAIVELTSPPPPPTFRNEEERLRHQLGEAKAKLEEADKFFKQLAEAPHMYGNVLSIGQDKRGVISFAGGVVEVNIPAGITVGDSVNLLPGNQGIIRKSTSKVRSGPIVNVISAKPDTLIVETPGGRRVIERGPIPNVDAGWTVMLDMSGSMALEAFPPEAGLLDDSPNVSWDDIGGLDDAKEAIREAIEYPITHAQLYASYGKAPSKGVLLYGPPGCGKTMLGKATATALSGCHGGNAKGGFIYVKGPELLSKWVGDSESNVRRLFDQCRDYKRKTGHSAVLFIDEAEALLSARGGDRHAGGAGYMSGTIVPAFLAEMDGMGPSAAFVMLATNRPEILDSAVTRDGRIDRRIGIQRPGKSEVAKILDIHLRGKPTKDEGLKEYALEILYSEEHKVAEHDVGALAINLHAQTAEATEPQTVRLTLSEILSGAVINGIVSRATEFAIRRDRESEANTVSGINRDDVQKAIVAACAEMRHTDLREDIVAKAKHQIAISKGAVN